VIRPAAVRAVASDRAVIVGAGNVALDVARMLVRTPDELRRTDVPEHVIEALAPEELALPAAEEARVAGQPAVARLLASLRKVAGREPQGRPRTIRFLPRRGLRPWPRQAARPGGHAGRRRGGLTASTRRPPARRAAIRGDPGRRRRFLVAFC
jgi:hypothetical protein